MKAYRSKLFEEMMKDPVAKLSLIKWLKTGNEQIVIFKGHTYKLHG